MNTGRLGRRDPRTTHPQTVRGQQIDTWVTDALRRHPASATQLLQAVPASQLGIRSALLRLRAAGTVVCRLAQVDGDDRFPIRVWSLEQL